MTVTEHGSLAQIIHTPSYTLKEGNNCDNDGEVEEYVVRR